ncbi:hypothetical protein Clacol_002379 [Clathrus columnatus]|uniref:Aminotransferase class I/classII large domain-containing protein n=1 Tax=Clathrus columnatus TaxID=1419009 RepID=A0AAV5A571_9AGAM|nr:hypothetical protein Clacol_002379 [Clathrus columnatus]
MRELEEKLQHALLSRQKRNILRRLPSALPLADFCSNDYLSLASNATLRNTFFEKLQKADKILGSGGSRLLMAVPTHDALETRLARFFNAPTALLFNSGFDANVGFFSCVPQELDVILYDEYIHASVHDGMRNSRARDATYMFKHNDLDSLETLLRQIIASHDDVRHGKSSVFVAIESLYSMDGDFAPLREILDLLDIMLPNKNGHLIVDEAHATGIYGEQGRGLVSMLGLETKVAVRLHTFGKALASSGAVILTTPIIRDYLINYARSLIYTTALSYANGISIDCSLDVLESELGQNSSPSPFLYLPTPLTNISSSQLISPIIPLLTPRPRPLAAHLQELGYLTRPITHPTVPKGLDRVRLCIHAGNTLEEVDGLLNGIISWIETQKVEKAPPKRAKL